MNESSAIRFVNEQSRLDSVEKAAYIDRIKTATSPAAIQAIADEVRQICGGATRSKMTKHFAEPPDRK